MAAKKKDVGVETAESGGREGEREGEGERGRGATQVSPVQCPMCGMRENHVSDEPVEIVAGVDDNGVEVLRRVPGNMRVCDFEGCGHVWPEFIA